MIEKGEVEQTNESEGARGEQGALELNDGEMGDRIQKRGFIK